MTPVPFGPLRRLCSLLVALAGLFAAAAIAQARPGRAASAPAPAAAPPAAAPAGAAARPAVAAPRATPAVRQADYIVAVVNQELVTNFEVEQRLERIVASLPADRPRPPAAELRRAALDSLIEDRAIVSHARDSGIRIEEPELDRAIAGIAAQNRISVDQLRDRLRGEGVEWPRFRDNVRDQMLVERVREREVRGRIRISDAEVDAFIERQRGQLRMQPQLNIAQILVTVPEGASEAEVAAKQAEAEALLARVRGGEAFDAVAKSASQDGNRERGGEIGLRGADRLPDVFVAAVAPLQPGEITPTLLRSAAGFHVLKLLERRAPQFTASQTHARHILLRADPQGSSDAAVRRLTDLKAQISRGARRFEDVAREASQDGSAQQGGDLGWAAAGTFVPEFDTAMNALPIGGLSDPVPTRFGVHLIQVLERREVPVEPRQLREQARNVLREQRFEQAYADWVRDVRARAYVEMREAPLS